MNITIWPDEADQRFDRYLRKLFKKYREIWLGDIFSWIRTGLVTVNGRKAKQDYRVKRGDVIEVSNIKEIESATHQVFSTALGRQTTKPKMNISNLKKLIIYEDGNWIFWNKPAWVVIHPSTNHYKDACMNDYLEQYLGFEDDENSETFKPSFCYRLDKDTSGVLIAAKTYEALKHLNEMIRTRDEWIEKYYLAIVVGKPTNQTIDAPLFKWFSERMWKGQTFVNYEKWVNAVSIIETLQTIDHRDLWKISLIKVKILTGRMHQIRVHCSHINHPVLWDIMYWSKEHNEILAKKYSITRQLLHSYQYGFRSIDDSWIERSCPAPQEFAFLGLTIPTI